MKKLILTMTMMTIFGLVGIVAQTTILGSYYKSDTLTNVQNDTIIFRTGNAISAAISINIDVVSGTPTADLKHEGSIDGNTWYQIYADPETSGTPTLGNITIDSENAIFIPGDGYSGTTQLTRPFQLIRLITIQTGTGTATYEYNVLTR